MSYYVNYEIITVLELSVIRFHVIVDEFNVSRTMGNLPFTHMIKGRVLDKGYS